MAKWVADNPPFPGRAWAQWIQLMYRDAGLVRGNVRLRGRSVDLRRIDQSVLVITAGADHIAPRPGTMPFFESISSQDVEHLARPGGHIGLVADPRPARSCGPRSRSGWPSDLNRESDNPRRGEGLMSTETSTTEARDTITPTGEEFPAGVRRAADDRTRRVRHRRDPGIGAAISKSFATQGAVVAAGYSQGLEHAKEFLASLTRHDAAGSIHQGNVGSADDCRRTVAEVIAQHGRLDVLVNNAGITLDRTVLKMTDEDWYKVLAVNLSGAFFMSPGGAAAHD